jgi:Predicted hydrolase (metallo-beta-lactamase superfamily)
MLPSEDLQKPFAIHLLDVGLEEYGDALLCQFGDVTVLIDGAHTGDQKGKAGHKSIPDQIGELLKQTPPYRVTLLMVSHAHEDHIGCLPNLVANDLLVADFALVADPALGWGRATDDAGIVADNPQVQQVAAGLREHIRTQGTDDRSLAQFLADAATLESRYKAMLDTIKQHGTVIRHGRDNPKKLIDALKAKGVTLNILGPSKDQLAICAERIQQATDAALSNISDAFQSDASLDAVTLYRQIVGTGPDAIDDSGRPGAAVNLQSIVVSFGYKEKKFLFAGDMQFEAPGIPGVDGLMEALRTKVKNEGPYSFVKLSHHGSDNAFSEEIYQELNEQGSSRLFGICAGEQSTDHPNPATLKVLQNHKSEISWARTDHNRQSSFFFDKPTPQIAIEKGKINDSKPNTDQPVLETREIEPIREQGTPERMTAAQNVVVASKGEAVEVNLRIPHASTKVTLTIEVEPRGVVPNDKVEAPASGTADLLPPLSIAGGRQLPKLLFVTSKQALANNIGPRQADHVLHALQSQKMLVFDEIPVGMTTAKQAAVLVREQLRRNPGVKGVVILGGYDVVPSQSVDCLPPELRSKVAGNGDADNFIVWSDDIYGDTDGDFLPELPVSRIPDGNRAELVFAALQASDSSVGQPRTGVRNVARPFAEGVFRNLPGEADILVSRPLTFDGTPHYLLLGDRVYLMLHGDYADSSRFWGEDTEANREAVNISNLPTNCGAVVFTGCCWGALTVDTPAGRVVNGRPYGKKSADDSLAMAFLRRGTVGFIGCTGSHYSPLESPFNFFGGPMHEAFWSAYSIQRFPALALFQAKLQYVKGMPHGQTTPNAQAIEFKILRQYTCLGLGW